MPRNSRGSTCIARQPQLCRGDEEAAAPGSGVSSKIQSYQAAAGGRRNVPLPFATSLRTDVPEFKEIFMYSPPGVSSIHHQVRADVRDSLIALCRNICVTAAMSRGQAFRHLMMLPRCILLAPRHKQQRQSATNRQIRSRRERWLSYDIMSLWRETKDTAVQFDRAYRRARASRCTTAVDDAHIGKAA